MYQPADVIGPVWRDGEFERLPPFMARAAHERFPLAGTPGNTALSESEYRQILAYQYGQISNIDQQVGRILDGLHQRGLERNTLVVFLSDHGDLMGDHRLLNKGPFHFEGLLRVPMIWRWPGGLPSGQSALGLASLLDFAPTVLDLLGIDAEALAGSRPGTPQCPSQLPPLPGRSLGPMLRGEAEAVQDSVLAENDEDYLGLRLRTLITPTYKLTAYTGSDGAQPFGELFDLARDPHELHNLWGLPEHRHDQAELMHRLHHRLIETESPLPRRLGHA
jgi:arylsulfatase